MDDAGRCATELADRAMLEHDDTSSRDEARADHGDGETESERLVRETTELLTRSPVAEDKNGHPGRRSVHVAMGHGAFAGVCMTIGSAITIIGVLTSGSWPIPGIGSWNDVIGGFILLYGFLFLLDWR